MGTKDESSPLKLVGSDDPEITALRKDLIELREEFEEKLDAVENRNAENRQLMQHEIENLRKDNREIIGTLGVLEEAVAVAVKTMVKSRKKQKRLRMALELALDDGDEDD